jgi:hypothetical protein
MEKIDRGLDAGRQKLINKPIIEVETLFVDGSASLGQDPGPGNGEAVRIETERLYQSDILLDAVIVIACNISRVPIDDMVPGVGEPIPDALALSVLVPRPFDLVCRCRYAPDETLRKSFLSH